MKNSEYKKSIGNLIGTHLEIIREYEKELLNYSSKEDRKKFLTAISHSQTQIEHLLVIWNEEHEGPFSSRIDVLKGGKGDQLNIDDVDQNELKMGMEVESEHTDDKYIALEIVLDHLAEFPDYYTKLIKMEKDSLGNKKSNPRKPQDDSVIKLKRLEYLGKMLAKYSHRYNGGETSSSRMNDWIDEYNNIKENNFEVFKTYCESRNYPIDHDAYDCLA